MKKSFKIVTGVLCVLLCSGCARVDWKTDAKASKSEDRFTSNKTRANYELVTSTDENGTQVIRCQDANGEMVTGFVDLDDGTRYFETNSGSMVHDTFIASGDSTYYFNAEGLLVKGEQEIEGRVYVFDEETGAMKTDLSELLKQCADYIRANQEEGSQISVGIRLPNRKQSAVWNNKPQQSASVMKVFVMGAVYENYEEICSIYGMDQVNSLLDAMITVSDNDAWSGLLTMLGHGDDYAGIEVLNDWCQRQGYHQTSMSGAAYENYTSAQDAGKILEDIENGELEGSSEMNEWLCLQALDGRLLQGVPEGVKIANKPGMLYDTENDTMIVYTDQGPYILTMLCTDLYDTEHAQEMMKEVSSMVYEWMQENL